MLSPPTALLILQVQYRTHEKYDLGLWLTVIRAVTKPMTNKVLFFIDVREGKNSIRSQNSKKAASLVDFERSSRTLP